MEGNAAPVRSATPAETAVIKRTTTEAATPHAHSLVGLTVLGLGVVLILTRSEERFWRFGL
jgi:hypothetical protein